MAKKQMEDFDGNPLVDSEGKPVMRDDNTPATRQERLFEMVGPNATDRATAVDLRELSIEQLTEAFGVATATEAIGTDQWGVILEDKGKLCGVPLVIVRWDFYHSDELGTDFASLWVHVLTSGDRYIVNDGSTGIYAQLRDLTNEKKLNAMLGCKHGFRVSEYDFERADGSKGRAKTYYIDTKL